ncbi:hypothetical protein [Streptomyces chartreusis]|uniref:hypothetical protein n=1 Tax=Streptomyces chartreusis TaxID=1969 RepID=UPI003664F3B0
MKAAEDAAIRAWSADNVIAHFIRHLAEGLHDHPTLAYALLPLARDQRNASDSEPVLDVGFWQIAEFLGKLLERQEVHDQGDIPTVEVAELYLSGLLTWIVQHPERSGGDAAKLVLSQLL